MDPAHIRTVHAVPEAYGEFQNLYLDRKTMRLRPNLTFVRSDGSVFFETNEIELKGDPVDPDRKLAVVWGDSVVFGVGRGWPCLLDEMVPGYQFLNGGIPGDPAENILNRAIGLNREREVVLNIILPGWHGNSTALEGQSTAALNHIPNAVLATMPTALNRRIVDADLSALLRPGDINVCFYLPSRDHSYSVAAQAQWFQHIAMRNAATVKVAAEKGVPLIDLFAVFDTEQVADFREDFFDAFHPRPSAYPKMARVVFEGIRSLVGSL